jgi:alpha-amylase/alpha-mannosidase (GH57 family)
MIWSNFLHIYQPPEQNKDIVNRITFESYRPIINVLKNNPKARLTLNINACLTEQLIECSHSDMVDDMRELLKEGRLEITETAKYHALLALLPETEIRRQIQLNRETHQKIFGEVYQPKGFFIPEMAYSRKIADIVADMGYKWVIISEISLGGKQNSHIDSGQIYYLKRRPELKVFFRSQHVSDLMHRQGIKNIKRFENEIEGIIDKSGYIITAMDGEVFGHHRPGYGKFLQELYATKNISFSTISGLLDKYPVKNEIEPQNSSWSSLEEELASGIPHSLWNYPGNPVHEKQWQLTDLAIKTVAESKKDSKYEDARNLLDAALFSCQYWWACSIPWWKIEMIEKGAFMLKESIDSLNEKKSAKKEAAKIYNEIMAIAFDLERSGKAHNKAEYYTKKISQELGEYVP